KRERESGCRGVLPNGVGSGNGAQGRDFGRGHYEVLQASRIPPPRGRTDDARECQERWVPRPRNGQGNVQTKPGGPQPPRALRPALVKLGLKDEVLAGLDTPAQELLRLATGRNARSSYVKAFRAFHAARIAVDAERELRMGHSSHPPDAFAPASGVEVGILS